MDTRLRGPKSSISIGHSLKSLLLLVVVVVVVVGMALLMGGAEAFAPAAAARPGCHLLSLQAPKRPSAPARGSPLAPLPASPPSPAATATVLRARRGKGSEPSGEEEEEDDDDFVVVVGDEEEEEVVDDPLALGDFLMDPLEAPVALGAAAPAAAPALSSPPDGPRRDFMQTVDVPYYFLRDELGLGEGRMLRISLDHGQVLALSVQRSLRPKVAWLREALQLSRAEAAAVVGASPYLLLLSVEDNLAPKLRWLKDELSLSDAERRRLVLRCPQLLTASTGALLLKLAFLKDDVGLTPQELGRAVRTMPALLVLSLDTLVDKAEFLTQEMGMTMRDVGFLLVRSPALFFQAVDTGLKPKVRFLRRDMGLDTELLRALVLRAPRLLNYRVAARGRALLQYLARPPLDLSREEAVKLALRAPGLLATDVTSPRFHEALRALGEVMDLGGTELASVIRRFPGALSLTAARISEVQEALMAPPLACSPPEAAEVLRKHPQALGYRTEAVQGKLAAVADAYGLTPDDAAVKAALLKAPALLSYSLDGRLRPRLSAAAAAGVSVERAVTMLSLPAGRFEERLDRCSSSGGGGADLPPLLRQRANARLRKVLMAQRKGRREQEREGVEGRKKGRGNAKQSEGGKEGMGG